MLSDWKMMKTEKLYMCNGKNPKCLKDKNNICYMNPINAGYLEVCRHTTSKEYSLVKEAKENNIIINTIFESVDVGNKILEVEQINLFKDVS